MNKKSKIGMESNFTPHREQTARATGARLYIAPSIEITDIRTVGSLMSASGMRVIATPEVTEWVDQTEDKDVWLLP